MITRATLLGRVSSAFVRLRTAQRYRRELWENLATFRRSCEERRLTPAQTANAVKGFLHGKDEDAWRRLYEEHAAAAKRELFAATLPLFSLFLVCLLLGAGFFFSSLPFTSLSELTGAVIASPAILEQVPFAIVAPNGSVIEAEADRWYEDVALSDDMAMSSATTSPESWVDDAEHLPLSRPGFPLRGGSSGGSRIQREERFTLPLDRGGLERITFRGLRRGGAFELGVDEPNSSRFVIDDRNPVRVFALDPTGLDFTSATVEGIALGTELWKCQEWNFTEQRCAGEWRFLQMLSPGRAYSFELTPLDPGYAEIFNPNAAGDIEITALDNETIVLAWVDGTTFVTSFEVWHTNGTLLVNQTDVDTGGDANSRVSVETINATHFSLALIDSPEDDLDLFIYNRTGAQILSRTQLDSNVGTISDVGLAQLGDRFMVCNANQNDGDADFRIRNNTGSAITGELNVDGNANPGANGQNIIDCAPVNSTAFVVGWFDDGSNYASIRTVNAAGTLLSGQTNLDTAVGETAQMAVAGLRNNRFAALFYDSADQNIYLAVREASGTTISNISGPTSIDAQAGVVSRVSVAAIERNGTIRIVAAWQDINSGLLEAAVYNETGGQITAPFTITTTPNSSFLLFEVTGSNPTTRYGLCDGTFAISYTNATGGAVFATYRDDGSRWDGNCFDRVKPNVTLSSPEDGEFSFSSMVDFNFTVVDAWDAVLANCTLSTNISGSWAPNATITGVQNGTATNITVAGISDGVYAWNVNCSDQAGNWDVADENFTVKVNAEGPIIANPGINATEINQSESVRFNVSITDLFGVSTGLVELLFPNGTVLTYALNATGDEYWYVFNETAQLGTYNVTLIWANDTAGVESQNASPGLFFTVTASPPAPFSLLSPANGTVSSDLSPFLSWEETTETHFANYTVLLDDDPLFSTPDFIYSTESIDNVSLTAGLLGENIPYWWRVIAFDVFGNSRNSTQVHIYTTDTIDPSVTLDAPGDDTFVTSQAFELLYTVNDTNLANCTLYTNQSGSWLANQSNSTPLINGGQNNFSIELPDGAYTWNVECRDLAGSSSFAAANFSVKVDTTPPAVLLALPVENDTETETNNINFTYNVTDEMGSVASCIIIIDGEQAGNADETIDEDVAQLFIRFVPNGPHTWSVNCTDENGWTGVSETRNLTVNVLFESDPPLITRHFPGIDEHVKDGDILFNFTADDATGIANCSLYLDGALNATNTTPVLNHEPYWFLVEGLSEGPHAWYLECYDNSTYARGATSSRNVTVDLTDPELTLLAPGDGDFVPVATFNFTYFPNDTNLASCSLWTDESGSWAVAQEQLSPASGSNNTFEETMGDGEYLWNVVCFDRSGRNVTNTGNFTVKVDANPPLIENVSTAPPSPATYAPTLLLSFNATVTDAFLENVTFTHNFTGEWVNVTVTERDADIFLFNTSDVSAGSYAYQWIANDFLLRQTLTELQAYHLLAASSELALFLDGSASDLLIEDGGEVNLTATMITPPDGFVELFIDGEPVAADSGTITLLRNFTAHGTYNITASYSATQNYTGSSQSWSVTVNDTRPPNVTLISPEPDANITILLTEFEYVVTDNSSVTSCTLFVNGTVNESLSSFDVERGVTQRETISLPSGNYSWRVACQDEAENNGTSESRAFSVDVTLPRLQLYESGPYGAPRTNGSANHTGMIVYASTTLSGANFPKYRLWGGSSWGSENEMASAGSSVRWVRVESNPLLARASETIAVTLSADGYLDAYVWDGSSWSFTGNLGFVGTTSAAYRSYDLVYETQRGRALVIYGVDSLNGAQDLAYRVWNGSAWEPETFIDDPSIGTNIVVRHIRAAPNPLPDSNEIAIAFIDATGSRGKAMLWDGSSWGSQVNITDAISIITEEAIGVAYEQQSGAALAVAGIGTLVAYARFNGSAWSAPATVDINPGAAVTTNWLMLKSNPASDAVMILGVDGGSDLGTALWNGSAWSGEVRHDGGLDGNAGRMADFAWGAAGSNGLMVWGTTTSELAWKNYSLAAGWSGQTNAAYGATTHRYVSLTTVPDPLPSEMRVLGAVSEVTTLDLGSITWNGSAFGGDQLAFTGTLPAITYESFGIAVEHLRPRIGNARNISLAMTIDGTEDEMTANASGLTLLSNATGGPLSGYGPQGLLLPRGASLLFSGIFSSMHEQTSYVTWEAYRVTPEGDETLLCAKGDRSQNGSVTKALNDELTAVTGFCVLDEELRLAPDESLRVVTYVNASSQTAVTKIIDNLSTFVELEGFILGNLSLEVLSPLSDPFLEEEENFTFTCEASCEDGYCFDIEVVVEMNVTPEPFTYAPINGSSGLLILGPSASNPVAIGELNGSVNVSFELIGNGLTRNSSVRCSATSRYTNASSEPVKVSVLDTEPPNVTLIAPSSPSVTGTNVTFIYNVSDRHLANCTLYHNGSSSFLPRVTDDSPVNGTTNTFFRVLGEGLYEWNVLCRDTSGNAAFAATNRTFTVDATPPAILLLAPADEAYRNSSSVTLQYNATDDSSPLDACILHLDGLPNATDYSPSAGGDSFLVTGLADTTYTWAVWCNDTLGNSILSAARGFTVDTTPPGPFSLLTPLDGTVSGNTTPTLSWAEPTESNFRNATLQASQSPLFLPALTVEYVSFNSSVRSIQLLPLPMNVVTYWRVIVRDHAGNARMSDQTFTYFTDDTPPVVLLLAPPDGDNDPDGNVTLVYQVNDNAVENCTLYTNITASWEPNETNASVTPWQHASFSLAGLSLGQNFTFTWNVLCYDGLGLSAWGAANRSVRIGDFNESKGNETIPTNATAGNALPVTVGVSLPFIVDLVANGEQEVNCTANVSDDNGAADILGASATLHHSSVLAGSPDNASNHYTNATCGACVAINATAASCTCSFSLSYYALPGSWTCSLVAFDANGTGSVAVNGTVTVNELQALDISPTIIDYGNVPGGLSSPDENVTVINLGNVPIDVALWGYATLPGDGLAMSCLNGAEIGVNAQRFSVSASLDYDLMTPLSGDSGAPIVALLSIPVRVGGGSESGSPLYWRIRSGSGALGVCNGTIVFQAEIA